MYGVDIGINCSSISLVPEKNEVLDYRVIFGDKKDKNNWSRIVRMADAIVDTLCEIGKAYPNMIIEPVVTIEEPIFSSRTRNPKAHFTLSCLYALIRNKLEKRGFKIFAAHPKSVKALAKHLAFKGGKVSSKYTDKSFSRTLNKKGMIRAFKQIIGTEPDYSTVAGRETLADSFFIAKVGIEKMKAKIDE